MLTATLALLLATAPAPTPSTPTDRATFEVSDAEVVKVDNAAHLVAYDADGESTATLSVWLDDEGRTHVVADFADGLYMTVTIDGENVTMDSPDAAEVAARAQAIDDWLVTNRPAERWVPCGVAAAFAVYDCATVNPILCIGGAVVAACECLPLLVEEWEDYSCPGF